MSGFMAGISYVRLTSGINFLSLPFTMSQLLHLTVNIGLGLTAFSGVSKVHRAGID